MANDFNPLSLITAPVTGLFSAVGAGKQADAAKEAAKTQSDAGLKVAQIQADSAAAQGKLTAQTAADALNYSRGQSQLSLDQYNQQQTRLQPYRNLGSFALGQPLQGAPTPLTLPNLPGTQTAPTSSTMPSGSTSGSSANLSDPAAWMSLVGNDSALTDWVKGNLGTQASPDLVNYYVGKIKGQPGANAIEQAGSANYWAQKLKADPSLGGGSGSVASAATAGPVKLNYTPSMIGGGTSSTPTIGTLQAPPMPYRSLAQIAGVQ